jgi:hypothetical protein
MLHWVNLRTILRIEMRGGVFECASATSRTGEVQIGAVGGVWVEYIGLPHWPKRSAKLGVNFFQLCFVKKINWANQQELEKKKLLSPTQNGEFHTK